MSYETILLSKEDTIAIIKFNRPKVLNAINPTVVSEMVDALKKIDADTSIKVLILTGEGDKAFVAGADIASMKDYTPIRREIFLTPRPGTPLSSRDLIHSSNCLCQWLCSGWRNRDINGMRFYLCC